MALSEHGDLPRRSDGDSSAPVKCRNFSPPWFTGRWRDWHRGHGCDLDDGKPRSPDGAYEIAKTEHGGVEHPYYQTLLDRVHKRLRFGVTSAKAVREESLAPIRVATHALLRRDLEYQYERTLRERDELLAALRDVVALGTDPVIRKMCENAIAEATIKATSAEPQPDAVAVDPHADSHD